MPAAWVVAVAVGLGLAGAAASPPGQLVQLTGPGACASQLDTAGSCAAGRGLNAPDALAVSPDGASVYVAAFGVSANIAGNDGSVAVFSRKAGGRISQPAGPGGCLSRSEPGCTAARGLAATSGVAVSPDGRNVYATGFLSGSVASFSRSASGALVQLPGSAGCVSGDGAESCRAGSALEGASDVAISRDGRNAYVSSFGSDAVAVLDRDPAGALSPRPGTAGCLQGAGAGDPELDGRRDQSCAPASGLSRPFRLVVSPDGLDVYVLSVDALAIFRRSPSGALGQSAGQVRCFSYDGSAGECASLPLLDGAVGMAISPDGRNLYVTSVFAGAILGFRRNPSTGALTRLPGAAACVSAAGPAEGCTLGIGLDGVADIAVSPDGGNVYAVSPFRDAVLAFSRGSSGALTQLPGEAACISDGGVDGCTPGDVLSRASTLAVSPDGRNVYVTSVEPVGDSAARGQELGSLLVFAREAQAAVSLGTPTVTALRAGRAFTVSVPARAGAGAFRVACNAKVGSARVPVRARYANGTATCSGVVPKAAAGKRLTGILTAGAAGAKATARFSFTVGR